MGVLNSMVWPLCLEPIPHLKENFRQGLKSIMFIPLIIFQLSTFGTTILTTQLICSIRSETSTPIILHLGSNVYILGPTLSLLGICASTSPQAYNPSLHLQFSSISCGIVHSQVTPDPPTSLLDGVVNILRTQNTPKRKFS